MIEQARREEHPPWIGNNTENIITKVKMAVSKGAETASIKPVLEKTVEVTDL
jgi:hypothetical protein